ncbi:hypothetical protein PILCRDRAFT_825661 [Piloderma croceum F 1598]|uniref:Uncharacterized protein n=1 Tax=Piloderma croceum (strain F 1598) TaxID=765440 RepID=A0A0C3FBB2_PILCF|nr:hypothetical protein PILCRDRAFT_825661 [Piloderma croceum F 1598]
MLCSAKHETASTAPQAGVRSDIPVDILENIFREKTVAADDMKDLPGVCSSAWNWIN